MRAKRTSAARRSSSPLVSPGARLMTRERDGPAAPSIPAFTAGESGFAFRSDSANCGYFRNQRREGRLCATRNTVRRREWVRYHFLEALALMKKLGLQPRRTIRVAFWVNEENGGRGGIAYREWVGDRIRNQVAAIEMDGGAEALLRRQLLRRKWAK